jgi:hypothetical protein
MSTEAAERFKNEGNAAFAASDVLAAERLYKLAVNVAPAGATALRTTLHCNLALLNINGQAYVAAIYDTARALELTPNHVKAFYRRAVAYNKLGEFANSRNACVAGLRHERGNASLRELLAANEDELTKLELRTGRPQFADPGSVQRRLDALSEVGPLVVFSPLPNLLRAVSSEAADCVLRMAVSSGPPSAAKGGAATWNEALVDAMSTPKARAAVERAASGGDYDETRDGRRRVMVFNGLDQIANADPALLQRVTDGHALCVRCATRLAPASAVRCSGCDKQLFCTGACHDAAWWHRASEACVDEEQRRADDARVFAGTPKFVEMFHALLGRYRYKHQVVFAGEQMVAPPDADKPQEQRHFATLAAGLAFCYWDFVKDHDVPSERVAIASVERANLPVYFRKLMLQRLAELDANEEGSLGVVGFALYKEAVALLERTNNGGKASQWLALPLSVVINLLPLLPAPAGGANPYGPRPEKEYATSFMGLVQKLTLQYRLRPLEFRRLLPPALRNTTTPLYDMLTGEPPTPQFRGIEGFDVFLKPWSTKLRQEELLAEHRSADYVLLLPLGEKKVVSIADPVERAMYYTCRRAAAVTGASPVSMLNTFNAVKRWVDTAFDAHLRLQFATEYGWDPEEPISDAAPFAISPESLRGAVTAHRGRFSDEEIARVFDTIAGNVARHR